MVSVSRERWRTPRAIQSGLGARFGIDVADFVEHAAAVVVLEHERRLARSARPR